MELLGSHRALPRVVDRGMPPRYRWYRGNEIPGANQNQPPARVKVKTTTVERTEKDTFSTAEPAEVATLSSLGLMNGETAALWRRSNFKG